jgi:predicted Fe-Mo cluster-binding NifX family protein
MKKSFNIAAVTDDGVTISPHFGRARYYEVITVENGVITKRERREKVGHHTFAGDEHDEHGRGNRPHGEGGHAHRKHAMMADAIRDCDTLLSRGMGYGAYEGMLEYNIKPIVTDIQSIDEAVRAVIDGTIVDHTEHLH